MKTLVVIPARSGSKGLKDKNIKLLNGKPLIHYSIETAQKVFNNEDICFSTDSQKYADIAEETGIKVNFLRPESLATDTSTSQDVLLHCIEEYNKIGKNYDTILLLQPTSPFRLKKHLKEILDLYSKDIDMLVSVKETESNPYYVLAEENENGFLEKSKNGNFARRQDCPKVWEYNGSMYLINVKSLLAKKMGDFTLIKKYEMDSLHSIDIDTALDFNYCKFLMQQEN